MYYLLSKKDTSTVVVLFALFLFTVFNHMVYILKGVMQNFSHFWISISWVVIDRYF